MTQLAPAEVLIEEAGRDEEQVDSREMPPNGRTNGKTNGKTAEQKSPPESLAFEPVGEGGFKLQCGDSEIVLSAEGITLKSGAAQIRLNPAGQIEILAAEEVKLVGGSLEAIGAKSAKLRAGGDLELSAGCDLVQNGVNIRAEAKQLHQTKAVIVRSEAEGVNEMLGPLIAMNY